MTSGVILIISALLALLVLFVVAGCIETLADRQPPARVVQPRRKAVPLLPPTRDWQPGEVQFALHRARHIRAARAQARDVQLGRPRPAPKHLTVTSRRPGA
ncbi:hypothetical protein OG407_07370 [Streptomyces sp. NBC_01515]|uniref:hypothetical protein n=1 Tax=Streptomyces sp. NBC_01515 TaxID=2903890 RepID=UPI0038709F9E